MRIREPKTTALIFASGKMVVTGAKSEDDSRLASRKYARIIQVRFSAHRYMCSKFTKRGKRVLGWRCFRNWASTHSSRSVPVLCLWDVTVVLERD
jgi:hypothetical protein